MSNPGVPGVGVTPLVGGNAVTAGNPLPVTIEGGGGGPTSTNIVEVAGVAVPTVVGVASVPVVVEQLNVAGAAVSAGNPLPVTVESGSLSAVDITEVGGIAVPTVVGVASVPVVVEQLNVAGAAVSTGNPLPVTVESGALSAVNITEVGGVAVPFVGSVASVPTLVEQLTLWSNSAGTLAPVAGFGIETTAGAPGAYLGMIVRAGWNEAAGANSQVGSVLQTQFEGTVRVLVSNPPTGNISFNDQDGAPRYLYPAAGGSGVAAIPAGTAANAVYYMPVPAATTLICASTSGSDAFTFRPAFSDKLWTPPEASAGWSGPPWQGQTLLNSVLNSVGTGLAQTVIAGVAGKKIYVMRAACTSQSSPAVEWLDSVASFSENWQLSASQTFISVQGSDITPAMQTAAAAGLQVNVGTGDVYKVTVWYYQY